MHFHIPHSSLIPLIGHEAVLCDCSVYDQTGLVYSFIIPRDTVITCAWWSEDRRVMLLGDQAGNLHVYREDVHYHSVRIAEEALRSIQVMLPYAWILTEIQVYRLDHVDRCLWGLETAQLVQHLEMTAECTDIVVTDQVILVSGQQPMLQWLSRREAAGASLLDTLKSTIQLLTRVPASMDESWKGQSRSIACLIYRPPWILANDPDRGRVILLDTRLDMAPIWQWRGLRGQQVAWLNDQRFACWSPKAGSLEIWEAALKPRLISTSEHTEPFTLLPNGLLQHETAISSVPN